MKIYYHIKLILSLFLLTLLFSFKTYKGNEEIWLIKSSSSLKVDGKTNINSFACVIRSYGKIDTLYYQINANNTAYFAANGSLKVDVNDFDCHHKIMTKDLQKTLQSDQYPTMHITFKSFSHLPSETGNLNNIKGKVDIQLAGTTKSFIVNYSSIALQKGNIELVGTKNILFTDFNLKPPSKLGGTIKVKDQLTVEFRLQMKKIG